MRLRALGIPVCLALLGVLAPLRESVAASAKVDLEDYLGDVPMENDTKTFLTEGDDYTNTAIGVTPGPKRSGILTEQTYATDESTVQEFDVVVHGKSALQGTVVFNDGTDEIAFVTAKPKKRVAFQLKQGKTYKFKIPSKVFFNGVKVAKGAEYGTVTFLGFEDVVTPLGTFEDAAHFMNTDNLRIKSRGDVFESKDVIESWVVIGLGAVRLIQSENVFDNGQLTDTTPPQEWFFDHGVIQGAPIGPPMPASGASASSGAMAIARGGLVMTTTISSAGEIPVFYTVQPEAGGMDLLNANATVITQEFVGLRAQAPGELVGTRVGADGQVIYLPGIDYSRPASDANAP
jgi:hypothetical protein